MSEATSLFLILSGGYLYATNLFVSRFNVARETGHRLYFRAGIYGVFLFISAALFRLKLYTYEGYRDLESFFIANFTPDTMERGDIIFAIIAFYSLGMGLVLPFLLNLLVNSQKTVKSFIVKSVVKSAVKDNDFEKIVYKAVVEEKPVLLSMQSGKVYVGRVSNLPNPEKTREWISIFPLVSGYRYPKTKKVIFTTEYLKVYESYENEDGSRFQDMDRSEDFYISLPMQRIDSINIFDPEAYQMFNKGAEGGEESDSPPDTDAIERELIGDDVVG